MPSFRAVMAEPGPYERPSKEWVHEYEERLAMQAQDFRPGTTCREPGYGYRLMSLEELGLPVSQFPQYLDWFRERNPHLFTDEFLYGPHKEEEETEKTEEEKRRRRRPTRAQTYF
jgi:hypothetical protein